MIVVRKDSDRIFRYQGLTSEQVKQNRQKYGANLITPPERDPWWQLYLEKFAESSKSSPRLTHPTNYKLYLSPQADDCRLG